MFLYRDLLQEIEKAIDEQKAASEESLYYGEQAAKANREGSQAAKANVVRALEDHARLLAKKINTMFEPSKEDEVAHFLVDGQNPLTVLQGIQLQNCAVGPVLASQRRLTSQIVLLPSDNFELIESLIAAVRSIIFSVGDPRKASSHPLKKVSAEHYFVSLNQVLRKATEWLVYYGIQAYELQLCNNAKIAVDTIVRCAALLAETFDWLTSEVVPPSKARSFAKRLFYLLSLLHVKGHSEARHEKSPANDTLRRRMPLETGVLKKFRSTLITTKIKTKTVSYPTVTACDSPFSQFDKIAALPQYFERLKEQLLDDFVRIFNDGSSRELNTLTVSIIFEHLPDQDIISLQTWVPFHAADKKRSRAILSN